MLHFLIESKVYLKIIFTVFFLLLRLFNVLCDVVFICGNIFFIFSLCNLNGKPVNCWFCHRPINCSRKIQFIQNKRHTHEEPRYTAQKLFFFSSFFLLFFGNTTNDDIYDRFYLYFLKHTHVHNCFFLQFKQKSSL